MHRFILVFMLWLCGQAVAADKTAFNQLPGGATSGDPSAARWRCEPMLAAGEQWVLRCEDLQAHIDHDPALSDAEPPATWYVPTWSMPIDPRMTVQLVRAALCRGQPCAVSLKMDNRKSVSVLWTGPLPLH